MSIIQGSAHTSTGGYQIERSLRFNSADSAYLNRTFGTPTNQIKWTISLWLKRGEISVEHMIYGSYPGSGESFFTLFYPSTLNTYISTSITASVTNAVFRDGSGWYHLVQVFDSANATAADRFITYMNGVRQTTSSLSVTQNDTVGWNSSGKTGLLGRGADGGGWFGDKRDYFDGYLTEINFVDGQALTPSDFGETDSNTGVWKPKSYSGTYGNNGFYLKFADNSGTTSTTLGKDYSGNGNNWTPNNFSVTAGSGNDSLVDSPTAYGTDTGVGGSVRGNYATYNSAGSAPSVTLTNGNLDASHGAFSSTTGAASTFGVSSGKWYWEVTINAISSGAPFIGIVRSDQLYPFTTLFANNSQGYAYRSTGVKRNNGSDTSYGASYTSGDVIGVALDMDAGTIVFYKNNTSQGTAFSSLSGTFIPIDGNGTSGGTYTSTINFGQRPFAYTAPSGFKALCTQNLPTPTIGATSTTQANDYMNVVTYTGTLSTVGSNQLVTGVGFQPDFTWIKCRSNAANHIIADSLRYVSTTNNNTLNSNTTDAEADDQNTFRGFDSDGFNVGYYDVTGNTGKTYVAWNWKANGAGSSNTAGTITSTVSANTTSGFSIVTYTGNATAGATVGHGLGVVPSMIMVKTRGTASDWAVYHISVGATAFLRLNTTAASQTASTLWNNTTPTSTIITLGTAAAVNDSGGNVAYVFAPVAGYSAFGSYTGNGSTDGPFVFLGFKPAFVMFKRTDSTENWLITDYARNTYNVITNRLYPNLSAAEDTSTPVDFLSNGFKIRAGAATPNISSGTYIYAAFAETPAKFSLAR